MDRRKFLIGAGSLAAGSAAAMGTGAFTSVSANRNVSVEVANDADALLGLKADSAYASGDGDGKLVLNLDSDATPTGGGDGINEDATTSILQVFDVINQGTQEVGISIDSEALNNALTDAGGPDNAQLHFYVGQSGGATLDSYDPNDLISGGNLDSSDDRVIGTGDTLNVGLYVVNDGVDWDVEEDITINAYSETTLKNNDVDT